MARSVIRGFKSLMPWSRISRRAIRATRMTSRPRGRRQEVDVVFSRQRHDGIRRLFFQIVDGLEQIVEPAGWRDPARRVG